MMSSGLSQIGLGDFGELLDRKPASHTGLWCSLVSLKEVGVLQAGRVQQKAKKSCIMGNVGLSVFGA